MRKRIHKEGRTENGWKIEDKETHEKKPLEERRKKMPETYQDIRYVNMHRHKAYRCMEGRPGGRQVALHT